MNLFEYDDYRRYVRDRISSLPSGGRGQYRKIALALQVNSTLVSQIFRGDKHLTLEQAARLTEHLELSELEAEFFVALVEHERAGNPSLRKLVDRRIAALRKRAASLAERLPQDRTLSDTEKARFYSSWAYSAVRLSTSVPGVDHVDAIATYLNLPRRKVAFIVEFLLTHGLCVRGDGGGLEMGPQRIHVGADSPFVVQHHRNWRNKAIERMDLVTERELCFTAPVSISVEDFAQVRGRLMAFINETVDFIAKSPAETLATLNIDWFLPAGTAGLTDT